MISKIQNLVKLGSKIKFTIMQVFPKVENLDKKCRFGTVLCTYVLNALLNYFALKSQKSHMGDRLLDIQVGVLSIKSVLYMGKD